MKNLFKSASLAFSLIFTLNTAVVQAQLVKPSIRYGITTYSYFNDGVLGTSYPNVFLKSIITAPTIGLRLDVPRYHFGLETNYYQATVSSADNRLYQGYGKTFLMQDYMEPLGNLKSTFFMPI